MLDILSKKAQSLLTVLLLLYFNIILKKFWMYNTLTEKFHINYKNQKQNLRNNIIFQHNIFNVNNFILTFHFSSHKQNIIKKWIFIQFHSFTYIW
jgi:hypothetical protein